VGSDLFRTLCAVLGTGSILLGLAGVLFCSLLLQTDHYGFHAVAAGGLVAVSVFIGSGIVALSLIATRSDFLRTLCVVLGTVTILLGLAGVLFWILFFLKIDHSHYELAAGGLVAAAVLIGSGIVALTLIATHPRQDRLGGD
jgi:hypothetical protein